MSDRTPSFSTIKFYCQSSSPIYKSCSVYELAQVSCSPPNWLFCDLSGSTFKKCSWELLRLCLIYQEWTTKRHGMLAHVGGTGTKNKRGYGMVYPAGGHEWLLVLPTVTFCFRSHLFSFEYLFWSWICMVGGRFHVNSPKQSALGVSLLCRKPNLIETSGFIPT